MTKKIQVCWVVLTTLTIAGLLGGCGAASTANQPSDAADTITTESGVVVECVFGGGSGQGVSCDWDHAIRPRGE